MTQLERIKKNLETETDSSLRDDLYRDLEESLYLLDMNARFIKRANVDQDWAGDWDLSDLSLAEVKDLVRKDGVKVDSFRLEYETDDLGEYQEVLVLPNGHSIHTMWTGLDTTRPVILPRDDV